MLTVILLSSSLNGATKKEVIFKYNICAKKYNTCYDLLKQTKQDLEKIEYDLGSLQRDIIKDKSTFNGGWFPLEFHMIGYYAFSFSSFGLAFSLLSLEPIDLRVLRNFQLNIGAGFEGIHLSLSYSFKFFWKKLSNTRLFFFSGKQWENINDSFLGFGIGIGF